MDSILSLESLAQNSSLLDFNTDPGTFSNNTTDRSTSLPFFRRKKFTDTYYVYRFSTQQYVAGKQDGVYYLSVLNASIKPTVTPFTADKYSQPVASLFPQISRDNIVSDPGETKSFAASSLIGKVDVNDTRNSITKEALNKYRETLQLVLHLLTSSQPLVRHIHSTLSMIIIRID